MSRITMPMVGAALLLLGIVLALAAFAMADDYRPARSAQPSLSGTK